MPPGGLRRTGARMLECPSARQMGTAMALDTATTGRAARPCERNADAAGHLGGPSRQPYPISSQRLLLPLFKAELGWAFSARARDHDLQCRFSALTQAPMGFAVDRIARASC